MATYAKIQNNIVVNTQVMESTDIMDPNFIWVDVTIVKCPDGSGIQIGCTYDGTNFGPNPNQPQNGMM